ncbi:copper resistance system multicopper oxidase [Sulfitobacter sp. PS-8MA]|uniref:copper resistance system multicopper oxidase n=1 Tax=Sulfitobacter sp. PS-8MA TaxID=3237707 RepID=UPI0034C63943
MDSIAIFRAALLGLAVTTSAGHSALAGTYDISVDNIRIDTGDFKKKGVGYNNSQIPTVLRFKEGENVTLNVKNNLRESTSIHWHGLILPFRQDGVPGISFDGIKPGETFTYNFPIEQAGTYWFHSHSGFQEPDGAYGAIVIEPKGHDPIHADRDYVVQLTDKHPHSGDKIFRNVKRSADYYNRSQRTLADLLRDSRANGVKETLKDRKMWGQMRMLSTDIEDIQGFTALINGQSTKQNWTGLFRPGEKIRLRLINSSAMTYFDVRLPGLKMTVVQADGNPVKPVVVDELRIAVAETYDVIVEPRQNAVYSIIAESMGRTGLVRGTLSPQPGLAGGVPRLRPQPSLTMADMSGMMGDMDMGGMEMDHMDMGGMKMDVSELKGPRMNLTDSGADVDPHAGHDMSNTKKKPAEANPHAGHDMSVMKMEEPAAADPHAGHDMSEMTAQKPAKADPHAGHNMGSMATSSKAKSSASRAGHNMKGMGNSHAGMSMGGMTDMASETAFYVPGSGLTPQAANGGKFLSYSDLKARNPLYRDREATRVIELRLTGNMERYTWSINGVKMEDADPIFLKYGERVRFKFVNETMMAHPMHLHGMWSILDTGKGKWDPIKHTVNVNPGTTVFTETEVDAIGDWAFHCHLSYHAEAGMFRKVVVVGGPA